MADETGEFSRIRINLSSGELEIQGSDSFVSQYAEPISALLDRLRSEGASGPVATATRSTMETPPVSTNGPAPVGALEPFGQVLHSLATKSGTDQILLAGYYVSEVNSDGTFSTNEAHKLLIEQGVKLSNASQSLKNNLASKRVFKVGTRFKVAKSGVDYLKTVGVGA
jgi:hypothetical protein